MVSDQLDSVALIWQLGASGKKRTCLLNLRNEALRSESQDLFVQHRGSPAASAPPSPLVVLLLLAVQLDGAECYLYQLIALITQPRRTVSNYWALIRRIILTLHK